MRCSGYDLSASSDIGKAYVYADGELVKGENARHRLAFAQLLNVRRFPLLVFGVHENWFRERIGEATDFRTLRREIRELERGLQ